MKPTKLKCLCCGFEFVPERLEAGVDVECPDCGDTELRPVPEPWKPKLERSNPFHERSPYVV